MILAVRVLSLCKEETHLNVSTVMFCFSSLAPASVMEKGLNIYIFVVRI